MKKNYKIIIVGVILFSIISLFIIFDEHVFMDIMCVIDKDIINSPCCNDKSWGICYYDPPSILGMGKLINNSEPELSEENEKLNTTDIHRQQPEIVILEPLYQEYIDEELREDLKDALEIIRATDIPTTLSGTGIDYVMIMLAEPNTEYENKIAEIMGDLPYKIYFGEGVKRGA